MGLFRLFDRFRLETKLRELAHSLAGRASQAVCSRVDHRVGEMGPAEARGYIRARAASIVRNQVDRAYGADEVRREGWRTRLTQLTTDAVIKMVLAKSAQPVPVPVRRAA